MSGSRTMADASNIEWTDATWNIITGCTLVDDGCTNCYAAHLIASWPAIGNHPSRKGLARQNAAGVAKFTGEVRFNEAWLDQPLRWKKPRRIFVCAHGDLFHESVPDEWLDRVFAVMALCPQHTFQVLTKRPDRAREYLSGLGPGGNLDIFVRGHGRLLRGAENATRNMGKLEFNPARKWPLPNVWLGTSVSDQASADKRIPDLLATPAAVRFLSMEPLLGAVDLTDLQRPAGAGTHHYSALDCDVDPDDDGEWRGATIDWVIVGGESGPNARPMHPDWPRSLRDQCNAAGVPFFFKQWGQWVPRAGTTWSEWLMLDGTRHSGGFETRQHLMSVLPEDSCGIERIGKRAAGRLLDGREWNEMPGVRDG